MKKTVFLLTLVLAMISPKHSHAQYEDEKKLLYGNYKNVDKNDHFFKTLALASSFFQRTDYNPGDLISDTPIVVVYGVWSLNMQSVDLGKQITFYSQSPPSRSGQSRFSYYLSHDTLNIVPIILTVPDWKRKYVLVRGK